MYSLYSGLTSYTFVAVAQEVLAQGVLGFVVVSGL